MIASKDIRQDQIKKLQNNRKDAKEIFLINNKNNYNKKEALLKHQNENTNGKITKIEIDCSQNIYAQTLIIPEISKMQIDSELHDDKNDKKHNQKEKKEKKVILKDDQNDPKKEDLAEGRDIENKILKNKTHKDKLNEIIISNYGPEIYEFSMELERLNFCPDLLKKHKIEPEIRTKMIDWMIEVLSAYNSDPQTFSLAAQIMDLYIAKCNTILTNNDIHLIGIVSMYIASKMEDIIPLRMNHVKSKISHNKFSEKDIKKKEKAILETINFETITTSTYDFIRTFIFDFIHNNRVQIHKLDMFHHIDVFDNVAIFLSKLIYHSEEFSNFKYSLKAIACIVAAFDIMRSNSKSLSKESEDFMRQWILFLISESNYDTKLINDVYNKVVDYYNKYDNIKYISYNLSKSHTLSFY